MNKSQYTLSELAEVLGAKLQGDAACVITGMATLQNAQAGQITFLDNVKYRSYLADTKASAVIVSSAYAAECPTNALVLGNPYLGYAKAAKLFEQLPSAKSGIHATAVMGENCQIHPLASIGAHCVIGDNVIIDAHAIIGAHCVINDSCKIGEGSRLWPKVTLYHNVTIGQRCIIHSGAVLGSDGFGFAPNEKGQWQKIPQLGGVVIGDDVEIGANTTVDRGAIESTMIKNGVKIDNQVQIAHNVIIGEHTIIAGCVGIAGSTKIGKHCMFGGGSGVAGHLTICDGVIITGSSTVGRSINTPGVYSSFIDAQPHTHWTKNMMRVYQLDDITRKLRKVEKSINSLAEKEN